MIGRRNVGHVRGVCGIQEGGWGMWKVGGASGKEGGACQKVGRTTRR